MLCSCSYSVKNVKKLEIKAIEAEIENPNSAKLSSYIEKDLYKNDVCNVMINEMKSAKTTLKISSSTAWHLTIIYEMDFFL